MEQAIEKYWNSTKTPDIPCLGGYGLFRGMEVGKSPESCLSHIPSLWRTRQTFLCSLTGRSQSIRRSELWCDFSKSLKSPYFREQIWALRKFWSFKLAEIKASVFLSLWSMFYKVCLLPTPFAQKNKAAHFCLPCSPLNCLHFLEDRNM